MIKVNRLDHVAINVSNPDRSIAFYRDVLGMTVAHEWPGEVTALQTGDTGPTIPFIFETQTVTYLSLPVTTLQFEVVGLFDNENCLKHVRLRTHKNDYILSGSDHTAVTTGFDHEAL